MEKIVHDGKAFWDELNRLYYEKFPELREIACERCGQVYRDFDKCPTCGHSRWKQLGLPRKPNRSDQGEAMLKLPKDWRDDDREVEVVGGGKSEPRVRRVKDFVAIPTWIITRLLAPFLPATHPWYGRHFTLQHWAANQTPLCRMYDYALWVWLPATAVGLAWLVTR